MAENRLTDRQTDRQTDRHLPASAVRHTSVCSASSSLFCRQAWPSVRFSSYCPFVGASPATFQGVRSGLSGFAVRTGNYSFNGSAISGVLPLSIREPAPSIKVNKISLNQPDKNRFSRAGFFLFRSAGSRPFSEPGKWSAHPFKDKPTQPACPFLCLSSRKAAALLQVCFRLFYCSFCPAEENPSKPRAYKSVRLCLLEFFLFYFYLSDFRDFMELQHVRSHSREFPSCLKFFCRRGQNEKTA